MQNARLQEVVDACAAHKGVQVIDIVFRGDRQSAVVEIFIDAEQGITTEVCADVSREVTAMIEAEGLLAGSYRLEVSSPGADRPLRFPWQYRKHFGRWLEVKLRSAEGIEARAGKLLSTDDAGLVLQGKGERGTEHIPFNGIVEAKVKTPW